MVQVWLDRIDMARHVAISGWPGSTPAGIEQRPRCFLIAVELLVTACASGQHAVMATLEFHGHGTTTGSIQVADRSRPHRLVLWVRTGHQVCQTHTVCMTLDWCLYTGVSGLS